MKTINIQINDNQDIDCTVLKRPIENTANGETHSPMLIARYDGVKGEGHASIPECQHKPGCLVYTEGHQGRLRVDINLYMCSFIFAEADIP